MTGHFTRSQFYKSIVIILSFALTVSLIPPEGWSLLLGVGVAHATLAAPLAASPVSVMSEDADSPMTQALQNALPPDLARQLTGMNASGPDGQPNGMLMDAGAMQAEADREPTSLANPTLHLASAVV